MAPPAVSVTWWLRVCAAEAHSFFTEFLHSRSHNSSTVEMNSEPAERELMPGVFITDFRTPATAAAASAGASASGTAAEVAAADRAQQQRESKTKEQAEQDDSSDVTMSDAFGSSAAPAASASSSSAASRAAARSDDPSEMPEPAAYPRELPSDVEELQLQLAALEKNLVQLIKTNEILLEELKETPDEVEYIEAVAENRRIILQRSDRIKIIRAELQLLAPHRTEQASAEVAAATAEAERQQHAARAPAEGASSSAMAADEPEEGLFL
jgi:hypothetical protein